MKPDRKGEPDQRLADFLPYQLSIASNAVSSRIARLYRSRFGLSTLEWRVMAVLGDGGAMSQRDLARRTLMEKVPVSRACKALEDKGLVARRPNDRDGRSHLLGLSGEGQAVHDKIMPLARRAEAELFAALDSRDRDELRRLLKLLRIAAESFDQNSLAD